jgi:hypothetical protein
MRSKIAMLAALGVGVVLGLVIAASQGTVLGEGKKKPFSAAAAPGEKGGWDITGPYDAVRDWPKPMYTQLPGHEGWNWGAVEGVFAESPNRIFIVQRGELPVVKRPVNTPVPQFGPSLSFPVNEVPFRNASQGPVAALPGGGGPGQLVEDQDKYWKGTKGVDARLEHNIVVVNAEGNIIETWTQWDSIIRRAHAIYINPYDPEKAVWLVDDYAHAIFKFSNDGKKLLQTIGTPDEHGEDDKHFHRPTFLTWLPDSTMFVADGYNGTRVVKFDKNGKFLMAWGEKSIEPNEKRPGYFNVVHGIASDPVTRRIYVVDRGNMRMQVFDENGKFIDQWPFLNGIRSSVNFVYIGADRAVWIFDDPTSKIVKYDLAGNYLYSWGALGDFPGGLFNIHGASVDQEGNLYVAEVANGRVQKFTPGREPLHSRMANGRVQKFTPRKGANPDMLVSKPVYAAWK